MFIRQINVFLFLIHFLACTSIPKSHEVHINEDFAQLTILIKERLSLMRSIAQKKYEMQQSVEDLYREKQILDAITKRAQQYDIPANFAQDFFQNQMDAAKKIQFRYIEELAHGNISHQVASQDLDKMREQINSLNDALMEKLQKLHASKQLSRLTKVEREYALKQIVDESRLISSQVASMAIHSLFVQN